jgi:hypothetical protein
VKVCRNNTRRKAMFIPLKKGVEMAEKIQKELEEESHQTDEWLKHGKNKA